MKKFLAIGLMVVVFAFFVGKAFAQSTSSSGGTEPSQPSIEVQAEQILTRLTILQETLKRKKDKASRLKAKRIKLITKELVRAVNSTPGARCLKRLKVAMNNFYGLVSELGSGIACGPPIIPPYFPEAKTPLSPDCIIPNITPDQLDETFAELNPIYDDARGLIKIDDNSNNIPDICEGALNSR